MKIIIHEDDGMRTEFVLTDNGRWERWSWDTSRNRSRVAEGLLASHVSRYFDDAVWAASATKRLDPTNEVPH